MKKRVKLVKKLKHCLKQLNQKEFLHHFGPKKYTFRDHILALLLKEVMNSSFRRVENILNMFDVKTQEIIFSKVPIKLTL